jgi:type II secretory pathway pseudopilin PulG
MRIGRTALRGFTFVAILLLLALVSLGLAAAGTVWSQASKRERERELMRIGTLYASAIASYYNAAPGSQKVYPERLELLLLDTRYVGTVRHLRRVYPDPIDPAQAWGLVRDPAGRITGVYSQSEEAPVAQGQILLDDRALPPAKRYKDWLFLAKANP